MEEETQKNQVIRQKLFNKALIDFGTKLFVYLRMYEDLSVCVCLMILILLRKIEIQFLFCNPIRNICENSHASIQGGIGI